MAGPITAEYGTWRSPISADSVSTAGVQFLDLAIDQAGDSNRMYWVEARPAEAGRYVVCSCDAKEGVGPVSWTPAGFSARTRVHEYGGGALSVHKGTVYFSNMSDQRVYRQSAPDAQPEAVTPAGEYFYADARHHGGAIYCVREDHELVKSGERKEPENSIVRIVVASGQVEQLAAGADFYSCPRVSPDGQRIAWVQWQHPNMPWDDTSICWAQLGPDAAIVPGRVQELSIAGAERPISLQQISWTPDGRLLYIGDQSGFWNLYVCDVVTGQHRNLFSIDEDLAPPCWMFGWEPYCINPSTNSVLLVVNDSVLSIDLASCQVVARHSVTGYTNFKYPRVTADASFWCVAASGVAVPTITRTDIAAAAAADAATRVVRKSNDLQFDRGYISVGSRIKFATEGGTAYAYYYPPSNKDYTAPAGTKPPVLVRAHGGPTAFASSVLSMKMQYWTSRGYAIADVDYRGSTGFGKEYRSLLRYNWGVCDVQDCCSVVQHLAAQGLVDPQRACIDGGSAGGYTTLACLAFKDTFKAGASHYGVADLSLLMADTHKFESRYLDNLLGDTEAARQLACKERSPINFVQQISCPLVLFQGDEDKIVPPNQAELMYKQVKAKGLPCAYVLFSGEQHGFRKASNINTALNGQFYFFARVFGFVPADTGIEIPV